MIQIAGYTIIKEIFESFHSIVYRGLRNQDNQPVILKVLKEEYPTPEEISRYKLEYEITCILNIEGIAKAYELLKHQNNWVIILEDFGGESLKLLSQSKEFTLNEFLSLAIQVSSILGEIHAANIIHKDINPFNIVLNPTTGQIKIIDFGISTVLLQQETTVVNPNVLEGTLAYISPEQTGRMNRVCDYRTDFYSLGATFYELLTGQVPFPTSDAMELVHCHIAKQPIPPHEIKPEIAPVVSNIVLKLLAKTAEERYQSAWGLKADLETCLNQLHKQGKITEFILGQQDFSNKFQISQKLYGREEEVKTLLAAFARIAFAQETTAEESLADNQNKSVTNQVQNLLPSAQSEMMLVAGYSGIGKSALVQEIYKPITRQRGYFISGKFDQLQRNIPYSAVVNSFQDLIKQLLTESEAQLNLWKEKILNALGENGQIVIDVIPELELIIGKQPVVPTLAPTESQNRFNLVFQSFIKVFTKKEHPLVIFWDDLQWADSASLKLIHLLMTAPDSQYFLLIGAYRDNEVGPAHPFMLTVDEIKQAGIIVNQIFLAPLNLNHTTQLITDTLKCEVSKAQKLAELILEKTHGNPFFLNEFLKSLHRKNLLYFDFNKKGWEWSLENIRASGITDNVVELMASKIHQLSVKAQQVLKLSACIGNKFDLKTLSIVNETSQVETASELWEALCAGLILPVGNEYKFITSSQPINNEAIAQDIPDDLIVVYKFLHDRVQQAAYSLIPEERKQVTHWKVGQLLLKNIPLQDREEKIFEIVNQLNFAIDIVTTPSEREELAQLNLVAGKKAKGAGAYEPALDYLKTGIRLLAEDSWSKHYELTRDLYVEAVEAAYLSTDFETMNQFASCVLLQTKTLLEKVKVYETQIIALIAQNQPLQAVQTALLVLKLLDITFPEKPSPADIGLALQETQSALADKNIEDLIALPVMTAPDKLLAMGIIARTISATYFACPEMMPLMVFKQVVLSLEYGNSNQSASAYAHYGLILCGIVFDIDTGYRFGELALSLAEKFNAKEFKAATFHIVNGFIKHTKESVRETLKLSLTAYQLGLETGNIEYAAHAASMYALHGCFIGKELVGFERELAAYSQVMRQFNQEADLTFNEIYRQGVLNLMGRSENPCILMGEAYNDEMMLPGLIKANNRSAIYIANLQKSILCYLFQDFEKALENAALAEQDVAGVAGSLLAPLFYFYDSLIKLAGATDASQIEKKQALNKVKVNQQKLKLWADHAPMNFLHKFYLVEAERLRVRGQYAKAIDFYDNAIELAQKHEYLNEEALAHELTARFCIARGKTKIAQIYMQDARYCYLQWGATAKVKDLDRRYPQLLSRKSSNTRGGTLQSKNSTHQGTSGSGSSDALDLATVMKASQAIASEIVLDKLLATLMKILIENAGAQKGFLILETKGQLLIEAVSEVSRDSEIKSVDDSITVLQSIPVGTQDAARLPAAIINYVARTKESIVLNDASREGKFINDPYIVEHQPKSILCIPLITQGKLNGILYLENNLTTNAFTPDRLEMLKLLSSQAAISIENARLYRNLEKSLEAEIELTDAYGRFVPHEFLYFLGHESILDVKLGDQVEKEMSVLFSDIRSFTTLSETMSPEDNFKFINAYLSRMEPAIIQNQGFIDKYIGDAIMALFAGGADDAVKAGISMLQILSEYNHYRVSTGYAAIQIGIGINTGSLMLGTVGGRNRMDGTVISDAVNLASRIESLTKEYGVSLLITNNTFLDLRDSSQYCIRLLDQVQVKGKSQLITIYEVFDADPPELRESKLKMKTTFEQAVLLYNQKHFDEAAQLMQTYLQQNSKDKAAQIYLARCEKHLPSIGNILEQ